MISKELKKLRRRELVDIIYQLKKREDQLREQVATLDEQCIQLQNKNEAPWLWLGVLLLVTVTGPLRLKDVPYLFDGLAFFALGLGGWGFMAVCALALMADRTICQAI